MRQPPSQPPWPPPGPAQGLLPHERFLRWFGSRSAHWQLIVCTILVLSCSLCGYAISVAANTNHTTPTAQTITATDTPTTAPAAIVAASATLEISPTATPTLTLTPQPTPTVKTTHPTPTPTPKPHCAGVNNNPWCYDFNVGNLIYIPPSGFCSYFNCIASFYASDDPGDGFIIECQDTTFSQSGGESGACSHHGGEMRPLYSH